MPDKTTTKAAHELDLTGFFSPATVAIVGASADQQTIRGKTLLAVRRSGYPGRIFPVTRSARIIDGLTCYSSVADLPEVPDLAILVVPAKAVAKILSECATKGIKSVLIISSGFAEQGDDEGLARQRAVHEIATRNGMIVCGPNAEGFLNTALPLAATFSPAVMHEQETDGNIHPGHPASVSVVSQSGGIGFAFYNRGRPLGLSFSHVVSTGNEVTLDALDIARHLVREQRTRVLLMFLEGIRTPAKLARLASQAAAARIPIVAAKMGRSEVAARSAASHTGALTGSYRVAEAVFRHHGISLVDDIDQMLALGLVFAHFRELLPRGKRVGILSASGGGAIWMVDTCAAAGLEVPELDTPTREALEELMPSYGMAHNPVDITAQGVYTFRYAKPLGILCRSPNIDAVILVCSLLQPELIETDIEQLTGLRSSLAKPVVFCSYTTSHPRAVALLASAGFPCLSRMPDAARALRAMVDYQRFRAQRGKIDDIPPPTEAVTLALQSERTVICEHAAKRILRDFGVNVSDPVLVHNAEEAARSAEHLGLPVALKIQSPDISHKATAGGVALGLETPSEVKAAFIQITEAVSKHTPAANILGMLVEPMARPGVEMIVGVSNDPQFGPMLVVGSGGILVEMLDDVEMSPAPVTAAGARQLLSRLRANELLTGTGDRPCADVEALAELMVQVSQLAVTHADVIKEIDLNPVIVHPSNGGVTIADALIVKHKTITSFPRRRESREKTRT